MSMPGHASTRPWMMPQEHGRRATAGPRSAVKYGGLVAVAGIAIVVTLLLLASFAARPVPTDVLTYRGGAHGRAALQRALEARNATPASSAVQAPAGGTAAQVVYRVSARQASELRVRGLHADLLSGSFSRGASPRGACTTPPATER